VLAAGGGVAALVLLHAASWVAQALAGLRVVRRRIAPLAPAWLAPEVRSLAALALPFLCLQLLAEWRIHGPLILYRGVTEAATFGQFALAMQAMLIVSALPQALGAAAQPALVRAFAARDGRDLAYARLLHRYAFVGGTLAGLLGMALGPLVFGALLGETYAPAGQLVGLAMWCLVPITAGFGLPLVYTLRGEMRSQITLSALATLATALLVPLLGARYGSHGAVVGAALGFSVPPFVSALLAVRRGDGGLGELLLFPLLGSGATVLFYRVFEAYSPWLALAAGCLALAVFMTTLGLVRRHDFR
jgi:O-antigen/teichoic acid export membrane protein